MKKLIPFAVIPVAVLVWLLVVVAHRDQVLRDKGVFKDTDPEMAAAIARAQKTLPQFWQTFDKRPFGESNFFLMIRITDHGRIEHFQITNFERLDGKTMATIGYSPKIVSSVHLGDKIEIPAADITDWSYMRTGKVAGLFTMKPRFKHMPADQVAQIQREMIEP